MYSFKFQVSTASFPIKIAVLFSLLTDPKMTSSSLCKLSTWKVEKTLGILSAKKRGMSDDILMAFIHPSTCKKHEKKSIKKEHFEEVQCEIITEFSGWVNSGWS